MRGEKVGRRRFMKHLGGLAGAIGLGGIVYYVLRRQAAEPSTGPTTISRNRVPPGQYEAGRLQVLHIDGVPPIDEDSWRLRVYGLVDSPMELTLKEVRSLPRAIVTGDFHCVTGWSKLNNKWEGVLFRTIVEVAKPTPEAKFATIECEIGYTTFLPLEDLMRDDVLLAYRLDDQDLPPEHGASLRLVVPAKYAYKSAKWVNAVKFTAKQEPGYWEERGYSNTADPWTQDRYG